MKATITKSPIGGSTTALSFKRGSLDMRISNFSREHAISANLSDKVKMIVGVSAPPSSCQLRKTCLWVGDAVFHITPKESAEIATAFGLRVQAAP